MVEEALQKLARICNASSCRKPFIPTRPDAVYCSGRCRVAHHRAATREMARNEWYSPPEVVEAARQAMGGIDLDPASCSAANIIVQAETFYTVKEDGLRQPWFGRVWLNPPYSKFAPRFVDRFAEQFRAGAVSQGVVLLATHHLTTDWFAALMPLSPSACLPPKRLQFSGSTERPTHGSVLLGVGVNPCRFNNAFRRVGWIWRPDPV